MWTGNRQSGRPTGRPYQWKGVQIRNAAQFVFVPTVDGAGMGCGRNVGGLWRKYHAP
ncbi:MAG: hypothetical protein K5778_03245 [Bacteroidaceae bacterium]|nr:hypothetical protein [Bacteroidaceae bacterium]